MTGLDVDTVRLRGPVRDASVIEHMHRLTVVGGEVQSGSEVLPGGARLGVDIANNARPEAWVEFSAPKLATGSNVIPLPLRQAVDVAAGVYADAAGYVEWAVPFDDLRVQRLDLDRDFTDVDQAGALLAALSKLRAPYNPQTRYFPDPTRGNAATLTRGPAARWLSTLYDKHGEAKHRARHARDDDKPRAIAEARSAEGRLRYELRARTEVLAPAGLRLVRDLVDDDGERALLAMRRRYFDRVGYGMRVTGMSRAAELVLEHDELRANTRLALVGWLFLQSQGIPSPELHRNNRAKYEERCRAIGVTPEDLEAMATVDVRLDFDSGHQVAA